MGKVTKFIVERVAPSLEVLAMVPPSQKINLKDQVEDGEIDLSMSDLQDVPVKEILTIKNAHSLDLSNNNISLLPCNFITLVHLTKLDLSKNKLTELPDNFGNLVKLKHLDLYKNQLKHLPLSFGNLNSLKWLDLKDNPLVPAIASVAGPCLENKQCQECAKNIVAFYSKLETLLISTEEQEVKLDEHQKDSPQKSKHDKKKKEKKSKKQIKEHNQIAEVSLEQADKCASNNYVDVSQESAIQIKTKTFSLAACIKIVIVAILLFAFFLFLLTAAKIESINVVEDKVIEVWNSSLHNLPTNVKQYFIILGDNVKCAHRHTTNGIFFLVDYFGLYCGDSFNVIITELSQVFKNASQAANKFYINLFGNK